jgi:hypothetical protein
LRLNQQTRAPCLHVYGADLTQRHLTSRSSGHQLPDLCDHPWYSASGLLLLPRSSSLSVMPQLPAAHHKTSKHDSSNETKVKVKQTKHPGFEFKPRQVNDSSQSNQGIHHLVSHFGFPSLGLKTGSCGLVIQPKKSPRWFLSLGLKTKRAMVCRLPHKTDWRMKTVLHTH